MKGKMAIVGDNDSIIAFSAGGITPFSVSSFVEAENVINKIAKEYQIIFVTESLALKIENVIDKYSTSAYPIILVIPSGDGVEGYGMQSLKKVMEKALGVDILFKENND